MPSSASDRFTVDFEYIFFFVKNNKTQIEIFEEEKSLKPAVRIAFDQANPGEVILLSPASASFDCFKNYKERGKLFKQFVRDLQ